MEEYRESYKEPLYGSVDQRVDLPQSFTIVSCPNCASEIPAANLSIGDKIGKCDACQAVFSIEKDIQSLQQNKQKINQEILRPEGVEVFHFKDELELAFEQPTTSLEWILLCIVAIAWFPGIGMSMDRGTIVPFMLLTAIPSILSYIYYRKKKSIHRKYILIDDHCLSIQWRPKMFKSDREFAINDINQLFVKYNPNLGNWQLIMIIDKGHGQKHVKLTSVNTASKAKYLEQVIETHLGIQDVIVLEES